MNGKALNGLEVLFDIHEHKASSKFGPCQSILQPIMRRDSDHIVFVKGHSRKRWFIHSDLFL